MNRLWAGSLWAFALSMAALASGVGAAWLGHREVANGLWIAGTLPALAFLLHSLFNMLARRDAAIDVLALVSIAAAMIFGQSLTACVIAVMFVSGQAPGELCAAARRQGDDVFARARPENGPPVRGG